jgi:hypothetical protein
LLSIIAIWILELFPSTVLLWTLTGGKLLEFMHKKRPLSLNTPASALRSGLRSLSPTPSSSALSALRQSGVAASVQAAYAHANYPHPDHSNYQAINSNDSDLNMSSISNISGFPIRKDGRSPLTPPDATPQQQPLSNNGQQITSPLVLTTPTVSDGLSSGKRSNLSYGTLDSM